MAHNKGQDSTHFKPDLHSNSNRSLFALMRNTSFKASLAETAILVGRDLFTNLFEKMHLAQTQSIMGQGVEREAKYPNQ